MTILPAVLPQCVVLPTFIADHGIRGWPKAGQPPTAKRLAQPLVRAKPAGASVPPGASITIGLDAELRDRMNQVTLPAVVWRTCYIAILAKAGQRCTTQATARAAALALLPVARQGLAASRLRQYVSQVVAIWVTDEAQQGAVMQAFDRAAADHDHPLWHD